VLLYRPCIAGIIGTLVFRPNLGNTNNYVVGGATEIVSSSGGAHRNVRT
jgi:hypothetical protein